MKVTAVVFLASCFLLLPLTGCGSHVTGSNSELDATHTGGPDCTQSGCHTGFGAAGTVYESAAGTTPAVGATVKAKSVETGSVITLGVADSLGNFHYDQELSGYYNMTVNDKDWSQPHSMPDRKGCNSCHTWPPETGVPGRLY